MNSGQDFPLDLEREILVRLPVKSLLRFKCVCKKWYALIKTPTFIRDHCNRSKTRLLVYDYSDTPNHGGPITLINLDDSGVHENPNYVLSFRGYSSQFVGCVDGLFLSVRQINYGDELLLALWNPATREVIPLPPAPTDPDTSDGNYGLGLDPFTNDCKVVSFRTVDKYAAVYSSSTNSWKICNKPQFNKTEYSNSKDAYGTSYLNGVQYWLISDCGYTILSFDFSNDVFSQIEGPVSDSLNAHNPTLILLDDSIAILAHYTEFDCHDIWVMTQPGVWNKLFTFRCFQRVKSWFSSTVILVTRSNRLVTYNVRTQETRLLGFHHPGLRQSMWNDYDGCEVYHYKESLVTIKRPLQTHVLNAQDGQYSDDTDRVGM